MCVHTSEYNAKNDSVNTLTTFSQQKRNSNWNKC